MQNACQTSEDCASGELCIDDLCVVGNIVQVLTDDGRFTTLLAAAEAAGLVEALSGDDALTLFAPTDDAFAALEASQPGIIESLLADVDTLRAILLYRVAGTQGSEVVIAAEASRPSMAVASMSAENGSVRSTGRRDRGRFGGHGVVHVLDDVLVLLPPPSQTLPRFLPRMVALRRSSLQPRWRDWWAL